MVKATILAITLALGGCASLTGGGSFCGVMTGEDGKPLLKPTEGDSEAVSEQLAAELVTVLETGERLCGWSP